MSCLPDKHVLSWMKDCLFVIIAYSGNSGDRLSQAVSRLIRELWVKMRKNKFNIIVYTDVEKPLYIEHFRSFIQSNIANSVLIWWNPLERIASDLETLSLPKSQVFALVGKELAERLEFLREKVSVLEEF